MDDRNAKRRSWIKNIAIIFLLILLLLTFFSNTIMNRSLPEVAVQYAQSGSITTRIRGSGTVEANAMYEVKIDETRVIADIGIKNGAEVTEGDVIFKLKEGESPDYTAAEKAYESARIEYEAALLEMPKDFSSLIAAVNDAEEALAKAKAMANVGITVTKPEVDARLDVLTDEKEYLTSKITVYTRQLSESTSPDDTYLYYDYTDAQLTETLAAAEAEAKTLESRVGVAEADLEMITGLIETTTAEKEDKQAEYDELVKKAGAELDDNDPMKQDYRTLEDMLSTHEKLLVSLERSLDDSMLLVQSALRTYNEALSKLAKAQSDYLAGNIELAEYEAAASEAESAAKAYNTQRTAYDRAYEDAQSSINESELGLARKREDIAEKEAQLAESGMYRDDLNMLEYELDELSEKLRKFERDKTTAQTAIDDAKKARDAASDKALLINITTCERRIKAIDDESEDLKETLEDITAGEGAEDAVKAAERTLADAKNAYSRAVREYSNEQKIEDLRLEQQKKELDRLKAEYESLKSGTQATEITAPVSGVISSVNVNIGDEVQMNSVLCTIQLVDRGYSVSFNVTNDQAKRIKVGDMAEAQYYWGADDLVARVESVTSIQGDNQSKKVTLNLTGEGVRLGSSMTFILGERSQNYDIVVPKSALHEDSNGNFVLVVTSKSTPLGTRYTATRADVQVIASDDNNAAVTGSLGSYEYIITTASSPISSGMLVRLQET